MKNLTTVQAEVKALSPREKLTLLQALELVITQETGIELIHADIAVETYDAIAEKYDLYAEYDEQIECEDCGYCSRDCICHNETVLAA